MSIFPPSTSMSPLCVYVCVCACCAEREKERGRILTSFRHKDHLNIIHNLWVGKRRPLCV